MPVEPMSHRELFTKLDIHDVQVLIQASKNGIANQNDSIIDAFQDDTKSVLLDNGYLEQTPPRSHRNPFRRLRKSASASALALSSTFGNLLDAAGFLESVAKSKQMSVQETINWLSPTS